MLGANQRLLLLDTSALYTELHWSGDSILLLHLRRLCHILVLCEHGLVGRDLLLLTYHCLLRKLRVLLTVLCFVLLK